MEIHSTKDYSMFKIADYNREINGGHVRTLEKAITLKNLLSNNPIKVSKDFVVLDGQHRLMAAKALELPIFYEIHEELDDESVIFLNISRKWGHQDFLNYYCKKGYPEYIKLRDFCKKQEIHLKIALNVMGGSGHSGFYQFRIGNYVFEEEAFGLHIPMLWDTIHYLRAKLGRRDTQYLTSLKFWKALLILVTHAEFSERRWKKNREKFVSDFTQKVHTIDYVNLFFTVYNYGAHKETRITPQEED